MSGRRKPSGITSVEFSSELRRLNLTNRWFAEQLGFAEMTVSKWGSGELPVPQYVWYILQLLDRLAYHRPIIAIRQSTFRSNLFGPGAQSCFAARTL